MNNEHLRIKFSKAKYEIEKYKYKNNYHLTFSLEEVNTILEMLETTHNKDCAVPQSEIASPKPSNDGFAQS